MNYMTEANTIAAALRGRAGAMPRRRRGRGKATGLSASNQAVLAYMRAFFIDNDQLPPVSLIARHFGWSTLGAAHHHVVTLLRHGVVERNAVGKLRFARGMGMGVDA